MSAGCLLHLIGEAWGRADACDADTRRGAFGNASSRNARKGILPYARGKPDLLSHTERRRNTPTSVPEAKTRVCGRLQSADPVTTIQSHATRPRLETDEYTHLFTATLSAETQHLKTSCRVSANARRLLCKLETFPFKVKVVPSCQKQHVSLQRACLRQCLSRH